MQRASFRIGGLGWLPPPAWGRGAVNTAKFTTYSVRAVVAVSPCSFIHLISPISPRRGGFLRVRVEIMGSQKCRTVGKSQPVLSMSHPVVSPRTRTECAAVIEPADVPRQLATCVATQCTSFVVSRSRARAGTGSGRLDPDCCACPTNDPSAGDLLARVLADLLGCRAVLHRLSRGPWGR
eukprot:COSAG01_NODE_26191_length_721_cov_1.215434_1_plen_179_part_10